MKASPARIEQSAKALYESENPEGDWERHTDAVKDLYRARARQGIHALNKPKQDAS